MDEYNFGKKRKIGGDGNLADRISELPDEVLVSLLSLLPLKQAASTSILSRRWRYVWTSTMTLNFDTINFEAIDALNLKRKVKEVQNPTYVGWVNRVLKQYRGQNIERFRVCYTLDDRFKSSIDKWIQFAMQKNVQILELDFAKEGSLFSDGYYTFPHELLGINFNKGSGVEQPAGKGVEKFDYSAWGLSTVEQFMDSAWENLMRFRIPSDDLHLCGYSTGFIKSLKVLNFGQVRMRDEVVEYLLTNCPVLEQLSLIAAKNLVNLRVVGRSSPLKHLVIKHCQDLKNIEIRDANIVSFAYFAANVVDLLLHKVPLLVELSITTGVWSKYFKPSITQLSCCLSQLEILKLDIKPRLYTENYVFPMSPKLKHLELIVFADDQKSFHYLSSFLKASPYLQTLVLKFYRRQISWEVGDIERAAKCPHHSLKLVEIAGYRARTFDVEHVMYLIKNAVVLEKLVIDPVQSWRWPTGMDRSTYEVQEERRARYHAEQHLKEKVPSAIEFVCL